MLQRTSGQKKCILKGLFCKAAGNSKCSVHQHCVLFKISFTYTSSSTTVQLLLEISPPILWLCDHYFRTMPFPAAHSFCFPCVNSSAHLACTKQIREWIQLEALQERMGEKKKKKKKDDQWRWISAGSNSQISSRHTNISMWPGELKQKHYFWQEPTFMLHLSNYITMDFNKGDAELRKLIFWEGQVHKLLMQKAVVENCLRTTSTSTYWY